MNLENQTTAKLPFDEWLKKVRQEIAEETGVILVVDQSVRDAYERGDTPAQFVSVVLMEMDQRLSDFDDDGDEEE